MPTDGQTHVLTVDMAADLLLVERQTILRWIKKGKLRAAKPERAYRIPYSEVLRLLEQRDCPPHSASESNDAL